MIGRIRGHVLERRPPEIVVEVNGIGYEIWMPMTCIYQLPEGEVDLFTHFIVREDTQLLYGFSSRQTRTLFRELIKINGVGPKLALAILSGMSASEFIEAARLGEINLLIGLPGVGRKTAERLVIEMRDRFKHLDSNEPRREINDFSNDLNQQNMVEVEAISALMALGYKSQEARKAINKVFRVGVDSQTLIKDALKIVR